MIENAPAAADLASLLTKAVGDITAALIMANKKDKIHNWTLPYITAINAHDAAATDLRDEEIERLRQALTWYRDQMCEGWCEGFDPKICASMLSDNCAGCKAAYALAKSEGRP